MALALQGGGCLAFIWQFYVFLEESKSTKTWIYLFWGGVDVADKAMPLTNKEEFHVLRLATFLFIYLRKLCINE